MIELRKLSAGVYATLDGRYQIEHQDGLTECDHPLCDTLHRKWHSRVGSYGWVHEVPYVAWHVWDTEKDDYATDGPEEFDSMREARRWLTRHLEQPVCS